MTHPRLDETTCSDRLAALPQWQLLDGRLHREYRFADFTTAFGFMAQAALIAEKRDHHPQWSNVYSRVTIDLTTHDAGGITELDFALAEAMERIATRLGHS